MRALKLVERMKANSVMLSEKLVARIRSSGKCSELLRKLPENEQKKYALEIYRDLTDWLAEESESLVQNRYLDLGFRRAGQGVPFSNMFWAVCITREYLWEYMQQECLLEDPVEFWGGVKLLHSVNCFFDEALYFTLVGYEKSGKDEEIALSFLGRRQSA